MLRTAPAGAQAEAPRELPCSAAEHRQFDFWIGEWEVTDPAGRLVGRNVIEPVVAGCALHESWTGEGGSVGSSYNLYHAPSGRWHQTWVDNQGSLLLLDGGPNAQGAMVLEGEMAGREGPVRHRITSTPEAPGRVRQHWEISQDRGASLTTAFDGRYRRAGTGGAGGSAP